MVDVLEWKMRVISTLILILNMLQFSGEFVLGSPRHFEELIFQPHALSSYNRSSLPWVGENYCLSLFLYLRVARRAGVVPFALAL